jgi:hypothetical protein
MEAAQEKVGRQDETQFTTKIKLKLVEKLN